MDKPLPVSPVPANRARFPLVVIIILSWDALDDTFACLQAAQRSDYPNYEILVVDNAQQPRLAERLQRDFSEVYLLQNPANLGYAAGNNRGISWALEQGAQWVLLLNDDITVEPDTCRRLVEAAAQHPNMGAVGGKIRPLGQPKLLWAAGEAFPRAEPLRRDTGQYDASRPATYITGCCILLCREALLSVGLFDESFFMLHEEKDWCRRAFKAGYYIWYVPKAVAWHDLKGNLTSSSSPAYHYLNVRNQLIYWNKHTERITPERRQRQVIDSTWGELKYIFHHGGKQRLRRSWAALRGAFDFMAGRFGPPPKGL
jgi:hypothetical protein